MNFEIKKIDETTTIFMYDDGELIGKSVFSENYMETVIDDIEFEKIKTNPYDYIENIEEKKKVFKKLDYCYDIIEKSTYGIKIETVDIMKEFRNQGYGKELFNYTLKQIKKVEDINFIYLNACPFDHYSDNQLELSSLIKFYEKYGFKVLIHQHKNAQMFIEDKSNLKLHNNKTIVSENKTMEYYNLNNNFEIDLSY